MKQETKYKIELGVQTFFIFLAIALIICAMFSVKQSMEDQIVMKAVSGCAMQDFHPLCVSFALDIMEEFGYDKQDDFRGDLYNSWKEMEG